jgi:hypothetical protein
MGGGTDTSNPQAGAMSSVADYNNMLKSDQQWNTLGSILTKGSSAFAKGMSSGSQPPDNASSHFQPTAGMMPIDVPMTQQQPTLIQAGNDQRLLAILRNMF